MGFIYRKLMLLVELVALEHQKAIELFFFFGKLKSTILHAYENNRV